MKKLFCFFTVLGCLLIVSCSKEYDQGDLNYRIKTEVNECANSNNPWDTVGMSHNSFLNDLYQLDFSNYKLGHIATVSDLYQIGYSNAQSFAEMGIDINMYLPTIQYIYTRINSGYRQTIDSLSLSSHSKDYLWQLLSGCVLQYVENDDAPYVEYYDQIVGLESDILNDSYYETADYVSEQQSILTQIGH